MATPIPRRSWPPRRGKLAAPRAAWQAPFACPRAPAPPPPPQSVAPARAEGGERQPKGAIFESGRIEPERGEEARPGQQDERGKSTGPQPRPRPGENGAGEPPALLIAPSLCTSPPPTSATQRRRLLRKVGSPTSRIRPGPSGAPPSAATHSLCGRPRPSFLPSCAPAVRLPFALTAGNAQMLRRAMLKSAIVDEVAAGVAFFRFVPHFERKPMAS